MTDPDDVPIERGLVDELPRGPASGARVLAALAIAAAALGALVHLQTRDEPISPAPIAVPAPVALPEAAPSGAHGIPVAPEILPPTPEASHVAVPDFTGLRVPVARRRARELGVRLVIRDADDYTIDAYRSPRYRVTSQTIAAGSSVERGSIVRAVAVAPSPRVVFGY